MLDPVPAENATFVVEVAGCDVDEVPSAVRVVVLEMLDEVPVLDEVTATVEVATVSVVVGPVLVVAVLDAVVGAVVEESEDTGVVTVVVTPDVAAPVDVVGTVVDTVVGTVVGVDAVDIDGAGPGAGDGMEFVERPEYVVGAGDSVVRIWFPETGGTEVEGPSVVVDVVSVDETTTLVATELVACVVPTTAVVDATGVVAVVVVPVVVTVDVPVVVTAVVTVVVTAIVEVVAVGGAVVEELDAVDTVGSGASVVVVTTVDCAPDVLMPTG